MDFGPGVSELSSLSSTEDTALLENTRQRYDASQIYTRSGRLLLAVNPYRKLNCYTDRVLEQYKASLQPQAELPPHVYAVASSAHLGMMQNSQSQSVVISGESGAGKTETAKILLQYLAEVTAAGSDLHTRVLQTNPIMESFGCAKTVWNNNSSRFGKFLTLQFSASGRMQGAYMKTYLLEKSRITSQLSGEQNYHVLYQVAKGVPEDLKVKYNLGPVESWRYLNVTKGGGVNWDILPCHFSELAAAMDAIPTVSGMKDGCWRVLIAILQLGNASFRGSGEDDALFVDLAPLRAAAACLGCEEAQLTKALCTQNIKAGLDWIAKPNTTTYSQNVKDALSKALYSRLFDVLVEAINTSLMFGGASRYFIGAVDIFGFECFPHNSLEQLCINFANEKLQRMFTEAVFESILAEYKKEGIEVGDMSYEDNTQVVELIENSPGGILPLLAEECFFPNGSDATWLQKMKQMHAKNPVFSEDRMNRDAFTMHHYPGKVTYDTTGFLEKNKDPLSQDLIVLMQFSDDEFVVSLFKEKPEAELKSGTRRFKSAKFVGVIDSFRVSLNDLVKTLKQTKTHFIRCVKPNEVKEPHNFVDNVMMRQLYTSGVVQAVTATRKGFPDHLPFDELLNRFAMIIPRGQAASGGDGCTTLLSLAKVSDKQFRIGKTKVFLGVGVLDMLDQKRMEYIASKALSMQCIARMYLAKKELRRLREAAERKKREEEERIRREEKERLRKEEEERKKRAEEDARMAEETRVKKEAEEKERQERFRRARQLSFERKTAKKKREEAEKKKKAAEAEAGQAADEVEKASEVSEARAKAVSAAEEEVQVSEGYQKKLEAFQQDVAEGKANDEEMMNVAVVSDIGWKNATGSEPAAEDVWAQYDFKCAVSDVLEYAEYLGMDIKEDAHLLWIADEALQAPEPQGWEQRLDPKGGVYYYHPTTGMSLNQHPLDHHYQQFYLQMKAQYDAMYASEKKEKDEALAAALSSAPGSSTGPDTEGGGMERRSSLGDFNEPAKKKSLLGKMFTQKSGKDSIMTEEMYELAVELTRQQDGLGIGLTLDNIIVEVEPGGSVHAQGDLQYGDQIVSVDGSSLAGRMLKDVIVPKRKHQLVVRYTRMSSQAVSPRRARARKVQSQGGGAPRRIEELEITITREGSGRLGFGIDAMNTVVEVDANGPVAGKLKVGDKILAVDSQLLNYKRFVDAVGPEASHKLRVARLASANLASSQSNKGKREKMFSMSKQKDKERRASSKNDSVRTSTSGGGAPASVSEPNAGAKMHGMPALREVKLFKESEETKIGAVFHRSDDAFDKSFFNVEGSSVQPIIKKVDPGSMAESAGLVPGDVVLSVNGISGLSNFQVVEMLRKGQGVFNLVVISGRQVQAALTAQR